MLFLNNASLPLDEKLEVPTCRQKINYGNRLPNHQPNERRHRCIWIKTSIFWMAERSGTRTGSPAPSKRKCDDDSKRRRSTSYKKCRRVKNSDGHTLNGQLQNTPTVPNNKYNVGWICALHIEAAASRGMLDKVYGRLRQPEEDTNTYILGCVAQHNVVIACLPAQNYGMSSTATVTTNMRRTFPSISVWLLVGIAGGAPEKGDVRLGDVVVSTRVLQNDLGKIEQGSKLHRTGLVRTPSDAILTAISALRAKHETSLSEISMFHQQMLQRYPYMAKYADPGEDLDLLFDSSYEHESQSGGDSCKSCDKTKLLQRKDRSGRDPRIHYGTAASASQVMKHARTRDQVSQELDISCFEMEAAGIIGSRSVVSIRGISDYSDSHKTKQWQRYAAATAAAYAKELLSVMSLKVVSSKVQCKKQRKLIVKGWKTGDQGRQIVVSKTEGIEAEGWTAGNAGWQVVVSGDSDAVRVLQSLAGASACGGAESTEESEDETGELSSYCGSRSATS